MQSGDVKRGADVEVVLVPAASNFETDWTLAQDQFRDRLWTARAVVTAATDKQARTAKEREAARDAVTTSAGVTTGLRRYAEALSQESTASRDVSLAQAAVLRVVEEHQLNAAKVIQKHQMTSVRTDVNGHYVKQQLPPGRYYIFSAHRIFNNSLFWFQPIEIRRGETTKLDLTGSNTGWPFDPSRVK